MSDSPPTSHVRLSLVIQQLARRPWTVIILTLMLCIVAAGSASRLKPSATIDALMAGDEPAAQALARLTRDFSVADELIIFVSIPNTDIDNGDNNLAIQHLTSFAQRFTEAVNASPQLSPMCNQVRWKPSTDMRAFIETHVIPNALLFLNHEKLASLAQRLSLSSMQEQLQKTAEALSVPGGAGSVILRTALKDPLALRDFLISAIPHPFGERKALFSSDQGFFSQDGRHLLIRLRGVSPVSDLEFAGAFTRTARQIANDVNKEGLHIVLTGAYAIAATAHQSIRADMIRSIVLSVLFLNLLYLLVYRNIWMLPAALTPVVIGILMSFGVFAMLDMNLSPMTAVIGAILAGLGIDYCIHIISHDQANRISTTTSNVSITETLTHLAPALLATCVTSVIGFFAISQSSVPALREFGILGAIGLMACLLLAMILLPALLTVIPTHSPSSHGTDIQPIHSMTSQILAHAILHRRIFLILGGTITTTAILFCLWSYDASSLFDDDLTIMHPQPNEALTAQRQIETLFPGGADPLLLYLEAPTTEELVILAHQVENRLERLSDQVDHVWGVFGLASLLSNPTTLQQHLDTIGDYDVEVIIHNFNHALEDSPFKPEAFDDYRNFLRQLFSPQQIRIEDLLNYPGLADLMLPHTQNNHATWPTEAMTTLFTPKALGQRSLRNTTIESLRHALADMKGVTLTGITVIGYDTEKIIRHELGKLLAIAASVVMAWLLIQLRSIRATFLALLPAAFGMIVLMACMFIFEMKLNTFNLIAWPLLVGIGVDDGIFLIMVSQRARREKLNAQQTSNALSTSCHAISMTSLTTILTFGTLTFTSTPAIQSLGLLLTIGITASWIGAMWILTPWLAGRAIRP